jgi:hypothetical protein
MVHNIIMSLNSSLSSFSLRSVLVTDPWVQQLTYFTLIYHWGQITKPRRRTFSQQPNSKIMWTKQRSSARTLSRWLLTSITFHGTMCVHSFHRTCVTTPFEHVKAPFQGFTHPKVQLASRSSYSLAPPLKFTETRLYIEPQHVRLLEPAEDPVCRDPLQHRFQPSS